MDMRWLTGGLVLVGVKEESVRTESVDDWHAHLAAMVGESAILSTAAYPGLIRC